MSELDIKDGERYPNKLCTPIELSQVRSRRTVTTLNAQKLYELAQTLLPLEAIASIVGVSTQTLERRFGKVLQEGREDRKKTLLQTMWYKALVEKDTKMLIWLSKQYLGHKETFPDMQQNQQINIFTADIPK